MNFKGHMIAGALVGLCSALVAGAIFNVSPALQLQILLITVCFSLMPDLDISSIPQRWFYRFIFVLLIYLASKNQFKAATLIAICSLTPILSYHRSWTHSIWSAIFVPIGFILLYSFLSGSSGYIRFFQTNNIAYILSINMWSILAASIGWLTHLYVDYKLGSSKK